MFKRKTESNHEFQNYNLADNVKLIEFELMQYPDLISEWHDYEISPRNGELPVECEEVAAAPAATASAAHRRRLEAVCGCVEAAEPVEATSGGGGHRRLRMLSAGAAAPTAESTPAPTGCETIVAVESTSGGHRRMLYYRDLSSAPAAEEPAATEEGAEEEVVVEEPVEHHEVTLAEVVADTHSYYDEFKEIVEKLDGKTSISIFKFNNEHHAETDTILNYKYNLYQNGHYTGAEVSVAKLPHESSHLKFEIIDGSKIQEAKLVVAAEGGGHRRLGGGAAAPADATTEGASTGAHEKEEDPSPYAILGEYASYASRKYTLELT